MPRAAVALLLMLLSTADAAACSIPVFRFALERWKADRYEVVVRRRGELTGAERQLLQLLKDANHTNIRVTESDDLPPDATAPELAVQAPGARRDTPPVLRGPLTRENVAALLDSPARREIAAQLTGGRTAVVVMLVSGDPARDEAASKLLAEELPRLEKDTTLPPPSKEGPQLLSKLPLSVSFSVIRIKRDDANEAPFVANLLASAPGLSKVRGPIVLPIFGRGRLLHALHGEELSADELGRVVEFLCKACTCQDKELTPGVDLLFTADWDGVVDRPAGPSEGRPTPDEQPRAEQFSAPETQVGSIIVSGLMNRHGGVIWLRLALFLLLIALLAALVWYLRR